MLNFVKDCSDFRAINKLTFLSLARFRTNPFEKKQESDDSDDSDEVETSSAAVGVFSPSESPNAR